MIPLRRMLGRCARDILNRHSHGGKQMKSNGISLRRRQLMLAGTATMAVPTGLFAFPAVASPRGSETLLVSGRIVDGRGKPVAGALVEMASPQYKTTTDGDGRFMLTTRVSRRDRYVDYRVSRTASSPVHHRLRVAYNDGSTDANTLLRDEQGVWRTTFALMLA
jgi:hypothetical protein